MTDLAKRFAVLGSLGLLLTACASLKDRFGLDGKTSPEPIQVTVPLLDELAGQTPQQVAVYLGEADVDRAEGPSRFLTYTAPACRLYLIFLTQDDAPLSLRHLEMEAIETLPGSDKERLQACVGAVATRFQTGGAVRATSQSGPDGGRLITARAG